MTTRERAATDCEMCQIESDLFIRLCPMHAAAPELLAAVQTALGWWNYSEVRRAVDQQAGPSAWNVLRAAIAKAEGRSS